MSSRLQIREIREEEFATFGRQLVDAYSGREGFPAPAQPPRYYDMLANIGRFTVRNGVKVLIATTAAGELAGGVAYFGTWPDTARAASPPR